MTRRYRYGFARRLVNGVIRLLIRAGRAPAHTHLLRVAGRRSGRRREVPVQVVEQDGARWLVSPYGEVAWVRNARAAGHVDLVRSGRTERVRLRQLEPAEAAPVLQRYWQEVGVTRPYFAAGEGATVADFEREASAHPTFEVLPEP